jgi:hypothetical protein
MYDSMVAAKTNFHLYIFAFDDTVNDFFKNKYLRNNITVVSLSELEDPELLKVKPTTYILDDFRTNLNETMKKDNIKIPLDFEYKETKLYFMNPKIVEVNEDYLQLHKPDSTKLLKKLVNDYGLIKYLIKTKLDRLDTFYLEAALLNFKC